MVTLYCHTGGVNDVSIYSASPQPTRQPETISSGLVGDCNPSNLLTGRNCFVTPAIESPQQLFRIGINFLQRFATDARDHAGDEPTLETHFNYGYENGILSKGGWGCFSIVVVFLHRKLRQ